MSEKDAQAMIPISIDEFVEGISVPADLYLRLGDKKFVILQKAGQKASRERLGSYKDKKVNYLWVQKEAYSRISQQNITLAGLVIDKSTVNLDKKSTILSAASTSIFTNLEHVGASPVIFNDAKQITEATLGLIENHNRLTQLIESFSQSNDAFVNHSLAVSAISVMIGQAMGWEKRVTLEKLSLGGLLHDIGLKTLPPELLKKPLAEMSYEETQIYETHPYKGMILLQSLGVVPDDITSIVYEHQENRIGQGYPQRSRDVKQHPLGKVVAVADQFCYLTMPGVNNPEPRSPREALMYMEFTMGQPFNRDVFRALKVVVSGQPLSNAG
ncbi:MAG: HD domain-containing protein [Bdellovibrionales bacterium]|nr:HD domain-containing protein [Bdellovibrionales bacterium]